MIVKFLSFSIVVIILGAASYVFVSSNLVERKGQVVITDEDIANPAKDPVFAAQNIMAPDAEDRTVDVGGPSSSAGSRTLGDLSVVTTTFDGYGNRTETRVFKGDQRLRMVMVKTGAGDSGVVYVYGKNGGVKVLRGYSGTEVMSMTADQLATKAEIFETALDKERQKPKLARRDQDRLQPLDSSEIEINSPGPDVQEGTDLSTKPESGTSTDG